MIGFVIRKCFLLVKKFEIVRHQIFMYFLVSDNMSQRRTQRINSPFSKEQEGWIFLQYGLKRSIVAVKRDFRIQYQVKPRNVPDRQAFERLINRFKSSHGQVRPAAPGGCSKKYSQDDIVRVRDFFREDDTLSLTIASRHLDMKVTTVWRILRKELKWKSYRERHVQQLTERHKAQRRIFCQKMEDMGKDFPGQIIFLMRSGSLWYPTLTSRIPESGLYASLIG